jgi:hypothetical protein
MFQHLAQRHQLRIRLIGPATSPDYDLTSLGTAGKVPQVRARPLGANLGVGN